MESNKNTEIIANIKNILKSRNIKQADLARMCNIRTSVISEFLNSKYKKPSNNLLEKIAHSMNMTVSEITGELVPKKPIDKYALIIEKAKRYNISPEKLEKIIEFWAENK